jgi:hypothetical protein
MSLLNVGLDATIVNVALPAVQRSFHSSLSGPAVDRRRLHIGARKPADAGGRDRGPPRAPPGLPSRAGPGFAGVAAVRARSESPAAGRVSRAARPDERGRAAVHVTAIGIDPPIVAGEPRGGLPTVQRGLIERHAHPVAHAGLEDVEHILAVESVVVLSTTLPLQSTNSTTVSVTGGSSASWMPLPFRSYHRRLPIWVGAMPVNASRSPSPLDLANPVNSGFSAGVGVL